MPEIITVREFDDVPAVAPARPLPPLTSALDRVPKFARTRIANILAGAAIGSAADLIDHSAVDLLCCPGCGRMSLDFIERALRDVGLELAHVSRYQR